METLNLGPIFEKLWRDTDAFAEAAKLDGIIYRNVKGRKTLRFEMHNTGYFLKLHQGVGWSEIIKNLVQLRTPVISAKNEWLAIQKLEQLGVETMKIAAYGCKGANPAQCDSFIITNELAPSISLEDFCRDWPSQPPPLRLKWALIERVATMTATMHNNGINHRDCYICHFLLMLKPEQTTVDATSFSLHVIDLHRAQLRAHTPQRWIVKDVAGLYFSAMDIGLTRHDLLRFMRCYSGTLKQALRSDIAFWRAVEHRAVKLYLSDHAKAPVLAAKFD